MPDLIVSSAGTPYSGFAALATKLISQYGSAATLLRTPPAGGYSPTLGRSPTGPVEAYATMAVASSWTFNRRQTVALTIAAQRVLVAAQSVAIIPNPEIDVLEWNGMRLRIASGIIVAPSGVQVLYDLECVGIGPSTYLPEEIAPFQARVLDRQRNTMVTRDGTDPSVRAS